MHDPDIPAIDSAAIDALLDATGSDPAFLAELIDLFIEDGDAQLATMDEATAAGPARAADLRRSAHSLKGNSGNFGATALGTLCQEIERRAHAGELDGIDELLPGVRAEYARVRAALLAVRQGT